MHDQDIFFGPSKYSDFSFLWTAFLKCRNKQSFNIDLNANISLKSSTQNNEFIISEIKNTLRSIGNSYINKKDYRLFLASIAGSLTDYENSTDLQKWNSIFKEEFNMLDTLNDIKILKD